MALTKSLYLKKSWSNASRTWRNASRHSSKSLLKLQERSISRGNMHTRRPNEATMQAFTFAADITALQAGDTRVVGVPRNLPDKAALLSWYEHALEFPYFGANWDALYDCLCDLSWIKERRLVLYHHDVPLETSPKDQEIYVELLADVVRTWKPGEAHEVVAAFDSLCESLLQAAMRRHQM
jgi:hypothetical protein